MEPKAQISSLRRVEADSSPTQVSRITVRDAVVDSPPTYQAQRVRSIRESMALSQPLFALALNVSVQTVRAWEQGIRLPDGSSERLLEIAEKYPGAVLEAVHTSYSAEAASPEKDPASKPRRTKRRKNSGRGRRQGNQ
jgi:DNA-binding transcriptional regulator YiaG